MIALLYNELLHLVNKCTVSKPSLKQALARYLVCSFVIELVSGTGLPLISSYPIAHNVKETPVRLLSSLLTVTSVRDPGCKREVLDG